MARKRKPNHEKTVLATVLDLVKGLSHDSAIENILKVGVPKDDAGLVLEEARSRITLAADFNRVEQLGLAIRRLNKIVEEAMGENQALGPKLSIALRAQRDLSRLLRLYDEIEGGHDDDGAGASESQIEIADVRAHLATVIDVAEDYPVSEMARIAAEQLRTADADKRAS